MSLSAHNCNHMFLISMWNIPDRTKNATDRLHRMNPKSVEILSNKSMSDPWEGEMNKNDSLLEESKLRKIRCLFFFLLLNVLGDD